MITKVINLRDQVDHIIEGISNHNCIYQMEGKPPEQYVISKSDHDILANYSENKVFLGAARDKDSPILKNYLGVDLVIIKDKEEMSEYLFKEIDTYLLDHKTRIEKLEEQQEYDKDRITYVNQLVIDLEKKISETLASHSRKMTDDWNRLNELEKKHNVETHKTLDNQNRINKLERIVFARMKVNPITNELESLLSSVANINRIVEEELKNIFVCMSAKHAMKAFFEGYRLTRKASSWESESIKLNDDNSYSLSMDDLTANDWYIVS